MVKFLSKRILSARPVCRSIELTGHGRRQRSCKRANSEAKENPALVVVTSVGDKIAACREGQATSRERSPFPPCPCCQGCRSQRRLKPARIHSRSLGAVADAQQSHGLVGCQPVCQDYTGLHADCWTQPTRIWHQNVARCPNNLSRSKETTKRQESMGGKLSQGTMRPVVRCEGIWPNIAGRSRTMQGVNKIIERICPGFKWSGSGGSVTR